MSQVKSTEGTNYISLTGWAGERRLPSYLSTHTLICIDIPAAIHNHSKKLYICTKQDRTHSGIIHIWTYYGKEDALCNYPFSILGGIRTHTYTHTFVHVCLFKDAGNNSNLIPKRTPKLRLKRQKAIWRDQKVRTSQNITCPHTEWNSRRSSQRYI